MAQNGAKAKPRANEGQTKGERGPAKKQIRRSVRFLAVHQRAVAATGEADLHWKAEHPQTRHAVSVTKKQDRQVLIVINEQRKQVCQLTVESFFDNTPAGERLAFDVMREVAQEFVAGKLEGKAELAARRDAILAGRLRLFACP